MTTAAAAQSMDPAYLAAFEKNMQRRRERREDEEAAEGGPAMLTRAIGRLLVAVAVLLPVLSAAAAALEPRRSERRVRVRSGSPRGRSLKGRRAHSCCLPICGVQR